MGDLGIYGMWAPAYASQIPFPFSHVGLFSLLIDELNTTIQLIRCPEIDM
jgi:hypothetical protein